MKKVYIAIILSLLAIMLWFPISQYLSKVAICKPLALNVKNIENGEKSNVRVYGFSPLNKIIFLNETPKGFETFNGYFRNLNICFSKKDMPINAEITISDIDTIIKMRTDILKVISQNAEEVVYYIPYNQKISLLSLFISFLHWQSAQILIAALLLILFVFLSIKNRRIIYRILIYLYSVIKFSVRIIFKISIFLKKCFRTFASILSKIKGYIIKIIKLVIDSFKNLIRRLQKLIFNILLTIKRKVIMSLDMIISINKYLQHNSNNLVSIKKSRNIIIIISGILFYIIFSFLSKFDDKVRYHGDTIDYQTIAVNFAKGYGFNITGGIESFDTYSFKLVKDPGRYDVSYKKEDLHGKFLATVNYFRTPGFPMFMGVIYKCFGVHPLIVRFLQLLLLVISACIMIIISYTLWGRKGFYIGWISSLIFLVCTYKIAEEIMTETLIIFMLSLVILTMIFFFKYKNTVYTILTGVIFGLALLVKGSMIFIPVFFGIALLIKIIKFKDYNLLLKLCLITSITFLTIMPWTIYINNLASKEITELKSFKKLILNGQYKTTNTGTRMKIKFDGLIKMYNKSDLAYIIDKRILDIDFIFLSNNGVTTLYDGNNEFCLDGGDHGKEGDETDCASTSTKFYCNDGMDFESPIKRVVNFYKHNTKLISIIFPNKLISGFLSLLFYLSILMVLIFDLIFVSLPYKIRRYKVFCLIFFLLLYISFLVLFEKDNFFVLGFFRKHLWIFYIFSIFLVIGTIIKYKDLIVKQIPQVFLIVFLNFFIITFIYLGLERFTLPTYVAIIPFTIFYFWELCKRILTETKSIEK